MGRLSGAMQNAKDYHNRLQKLKMDAANNAIHEYMKTEQFQLAVAELPNNNMAMEGLVTAVVQAVTNPVTDFLDVLRAKGFRQGEIRNLTHRIYMTYCVPLGQQVDENSIIYEDILPAVAEYCIAHQEVFASIEPKNLR